mmetsp:Transcript_12199/g.27925  ORF Transcript_12199/g.27925 Transcript_12199/m.27925 type:complete len:96 (-) Transcript_12199:1692-1979(-)
MRIGPSIIEPSTGALTPGRLSTKKTNDHIEYHFRQRVIHPLQRLRVSVLRTSPVSSDSNSRCSNYSITLMSESMKRFSGSIFEADISDNFTVFIS